MSYNDSSGDFPALQNAIREKPYDSQPLYLVRVDPRLRTGIAHAIPGLIHRFMHNAPRSGNGEPTCRQASRGQAKLRAQQASLTASQRKSEKRADVSAGKPAASKAADAASKPAASQRKNAYTRIRGLVCRRLAPGFWLAVRLACRIAACLRHACLPKACPCLFGFPFGSLAA